MQPFEEKFKLVVLDTYEIENQDVNIYTICGIFGLSRIGNQEENTDTMGSVLGFRKFLPETETKGAITFQWNSRCFMDLTKI